MYTISVLPTEEYNLNSNVSCKHYDRNVNFYCNVDGTGHWSRHSRKVKHEKISLTVTWEKNYSITPGSAEFRVYFFNKEWDVEKVGLIYTDPKWIMELKNNLSLLGFSDKSLKGLNYSEQGMQGDDYVSMDVKFIEFIKNYFDRLYTDKEKSLGSFSNELITIEN